MIIELEGDHVGTLLLLSILQMPSPTTITASSIRHARSRLQPLESSFKDIGQHEYESHFFYTNIVIIFKSSLILLLNC